MATLVLADDHPLMRVGLRRLLESRGHAVIGEVGDGLEVVPLVRRTTPDVVLLDLGLPGLHGLEVLRMIKRAVPATKVLMVSAYDRTDYVVDALRSGASGYVLKGAEPDELIAAVVTVARGGYYVSPPLDSTAGGAGEPGIQPDPYDTLSVRQRQVLHLLAEGLPNETVAERLSVSPRTVESHRALVMKKLGLRTQVDLVLYALRRGIVTLDEAGHK